MTKEEQDLLVQQALSNKTETYVQLEAENKRLLKACARLETENKNNEYTLEECAAEVKRLRAELKQSKPGANRYKVRLRTSVNDRFFVKDLVMCQPQVGMKVFVDGRHRTIEDLAWWDVDQVLVAQLNGRTPNSQNSFREACQDLKGFGWREET